MGVDRDGAGDLAVNARPRSATLSLVPVLAVAFAIVRALGQNGG